MRNASSSERLDKPNFDEVSLGEEKKKTTKKNRTRLSVFGRRLFSAGSAKTEDVVLETSKEGGVDIEK